MCGRYTLTSPKRVIVEHFTIREFMEDEAGPGLGPRYNIAPRQPVMIVREDGGRRVLTAASWGLVPFWVNDLSSARRPINARAETAATSGMFKAALKYRRCLLPADGFFEWKDAGGGPRQPYLLRRPDNTPLGLAGLWEHWQDPEGNELETCTILTTEPNAEVESIHNRMPVIIDPGDYRRWLDTGAHGPGDVADLLRPAPDGTLEPVPVSRRVNNPRHDDPGCVEPAG